MSSLRRKACTSRLPTMPSGECWTPSRKRSVSTPGACTVTRRHRSTLQHARAMAHCSLQDGAAAGASLSTTASTTPLGRTLLSPYGGRTCAEYIGETTMRCAESRSRTRTTPRTLPVTWPGCGRSRTIPATTAGRRSPAMRKSSIFSRWPEAAPTASATSCLHAPPATRPRVLSAKHNSGGNCERS